MGLFLLAHLDVHVASTPSHTCNKLLGWLGLFVSPEPVCRGPTLLCGGTCGVVSVFLTEASLSCFLIALPGLGPSTVLGQQGPLLCDCFFWTALESVPVVA